MCVKTLKKLKHSKTLRTFVEYQAYLEHQRDGVSYDNVVWYLRKHIHSDLGAVCRFVLCCCTMYVFSMLSQIPQIEFLGTENTPISPLQKPVIYSSTVK
jgi:hypothetical protein